MKKNTLEIIRECLDGQGSNYDNNALEMLIENISGDESECNEIHSWIMKKQKDCDASVEQIGLKEAMRKAWQFSETTGDIVHSSGGFFKIIGVDVKTSQRESGKGWKQPMVDQGTESSIAGFIRKKHNGKYVYLVEAKFEPGNYGKVLISPTLQVTFSNLKQAHGGKKPRLAEYFDGTLSNIKCLYSHWLPEDGGRFYLKRVKYMIVEIDEENTPKINDDFRWVSIHTLKKLMHEDNLINPHVRSLLAVL